jgi:phosphocarrier protein HPr
MLRQEVEIINKLGLHARASAKLIQVASQFSCDVKIDRDGKRANAKSIMAVMMLAASKGVKIVVETDGADEQAAMDGVLELINDKFGEGE